MTDACWIYQFRQGKFEPREHGLYTDIPEGERVDAREYVSSKGLYRQSRGYPCSELWVSILGNEEDGPLRCEGEACYVISIFDDFSFEVWVDNPLDAFIFESQYLSNLQIQWEIGDECGLLVTTRRE